MKRLKALVIATFALLSTVSYADNDTNGKQMKIKADDKDICVAFF